MIFQYKNKDEKIPIKNIPEISKGITVNKKIDSTSTPVERIMPEEFNSISEPTINKPENKESEASYET